MLSSDIQQKYVDTLGFCQFQKSNKKLCNNPTTGTFLCLKHAKLIDENPEMYARAVKDEYIQLRQTAIAEYKDAVDQGLIKPSMDLVTQVQLQDDRRELFKKEFKNTLNNGACTSNKTQSNKSKGNGVVFEYV